MIYVATVHWHDARWIDLQLRALRRHFETPYRTFAYCTGIDDRLRERFDVGLATDVKPHADKLNRLAEHICGDAADHDTLLFLDGDALPTGPLDRFVTDSLKAQTVVAVRRDENAGEVHPHPCCFATTIGAWRRHGFDWSPGHPIRLADGTEYSDPGALIYQTIQDQGLSWRPMARTNGDSLGHAVYFGVYERVVYHHGAGFRKPISRVDQAQFRDRARQRAPLRFRLGERWFPTAPPSRIGAWLHPKFAERDRQIARNRELQARVFENIQRNPQFLDGVANPSQSASTSTQ